MQSSSPGEMGPKRDYGAVSMVAAAPGPGPLVSGCLMMLPCGSITPTPVPSVRRSASTRLSLLVTAMKRRPAWADSRSIPASIVGVVSTSIRKSPATTSIPWLLLEIPPYRSQIRRTVAVCALLPFNATVLLLAISPLGRVMDCSSICQSCCKKRPPKDGYVNLNSVRGKIASRVPIQFGPRVASTLVGRRRCFRMARRRSSQCCIARGVVSWGGSISCSPGGGAIGSPSD